MWDALGILLVGFAGADLATTEYALTRPCELSRPCYYETNPLMQERWVRVPVKVGVTGFVYWQTAQLHKRHPKWAFACRLVTVALWGYATAHNLREIRR